MIGIRQTPFTRGLILTEPLVGNRYGCRQSIHTYLYKKRTIIQRIHHSDFTTENSKKKKKKKKKKANLWQLPQYIGDDDGFFFFFFCPFKKATVIWVSPGFCLRSMKLTFLIHRKILDHTSVINYQFDKARAFTLLRRQPLPLPSKFDGIPYPQMRWHPSIFKYQNERKRCLY